MLTSDRGNALPSRRGFAALILAIGFVMVLATASLSLQLLSGISAKKTLTRLDNLEGFYSGELAVWHAFERVRGGLAPSAGARAVIALNDPAFVASPEPYTTGAALSVGTTARFAPTQQLYRRIASEGLTWQYTQAGSPICATTTFSNQKRRRVCLNLNAPAERSYDILISVQIDQTLVQLIALDRTGAIDKSFGTNGRLTIAQDQEDLNLVAFYPDGRILIPKFRNGNRVVSRYSSSGVLDETFGQMGHLRLPDDADISTSIGSAPIIHDSGAITLLIAPARYPEPETGIGLGRITASGTPDNSFGVNGRALVSVGALNLNTLFAQRDSLGRFIVQGKWSPGFMQSPRYAVVRFHANGALDTAFADNGIHLNPTDFESGQPFIDRDDAVWVVESLPVTNGAVPHQIVKYLSSGGRDNQYAINGVMALPAAPLLAGSFAGSHSLFTATHLIDVRSVGDGHAGMGVEIQQFRLSDGTRVNSFGGTGTVRRQWYDVLTAAGNNIYAYFYPPDRILLGAAYYDPQAINMFLRLESLDLNGQPDPAFGNQGVVDLRVGAVTLNGVFRPSFRPRP